MPDDPRAEEEHPMPPAGDAPEEQGGFVERNLGKMLLAGGAVAAMAALAARSNGAGEEAGASGDGPAMEPPPDPPDTPPDTLAEPSETGRRERREALRRLRHASRSADALLDGSEILAEGACAMNRAWLALVRRMVRRQTADLERLALCRSPQDATAIQARMIAEQTDMAMRGWLALVTGQVETASRVVRGLADHAADGVPDRDPAP